MEHNYQDKERYKIAQKRIKDIKGFYTHLVVYVLVNIFLLIISNQIFSRGLSNINVSDFNLFFFWGIGLFAHWASVFGPNIFLGKEWEEKKIREIMEIMEKEEQQAKTWK